MQIITKFPEVFHPQECLELLTAVNFHLVLLLSMVWVLVKFFKKLRFVYQNRHAS